MIWILAIVYEVVQCSKNMSNIIPESSIATNIFETTLVPGNETEPHPEISKLIAEPIGLDGGIVFRSLVLALVCGLTFIASCLIKRKCGKAPPTRRYQILEDNQLQLANDDSDSDIDIFKTTKSII